MIENEQEKRNKRCKGCPHAKRIETYGGFCFTGCKCPPYRGKWVVEIATCPLMQNGGTKK